MGAAAGTCPTGKRTHDSPARGTFSSCHRAHRSRSSNDSSARCMSTKPQDPRSACARSLGLWPTRPGDAFSRRAARSKMRRSAELPGEGSPPPSPSADIFLRGLPPTSRAKIRGEDKGGEDKGTSRITTTRIFWMSRYPFPPTPDERGASRGGPFPFYRTADPRSIALP